MIAATKFKGSIAIAFAVAILLGGWRAYLNHVRADAVRVAQWEQHDAIAARTIAQHAARADSALRASQAIIAAQADSIHKTAARVAELDTAIYQLNQTPFPEIHVLGDTVAVVDEDSTRVYVLPRPIVKLLAAQDTGIARRDTAIKVARTLLGEQMKQISALQSAYAQLSEAASQRDSALAVANERVADLRRQIKSPGALVRVWGVAWKAGLAYGAFRLGQASVQR